ncbi:hypothetical protein ACSBR2_038581 [Camellia fascicularis]
MHLKHLSLLLVEFRRVLTVEGSTPKAFKTSSSSRQMRTLSNAKFEVENFDGTNNFGMWQCEVMDVLYQQEVDIALEDKPVDMGDKKWALINH